MPTRKPNRTKALDNPTRRTEINYKVWERPYTSRSLWKVHHVEANRRRRERRRTVTAW